MGLNENTTRRQPVIIGHICSRCLNPVVTSAVITADISGGGDLLQDKTGRTAADITGWAVREELERIALCGRRRGVLYLEDEKLPNAAGISCRTVISDAGSACPNCGYLEPWHPNSVSQADMIVLRADNFPVAFIKEKDAMNWVFEYLEKKFRGFDKSDEEETGETFLKKENMNRLIEIRLLERKAGLLSKKMERYNFEKLRAMYREEPYGVTEEEKAIDMLILAGLLEQQRDSIPEIEELRKLIMQKSALNTEKDRTKRFHFRRRRVMEKEIRELSLNIERVSSDMRRKQSELEKRISRLKLSLQSELAYVYGYTGRYIKDENGKTAVFRLQLNPVPEADIEARIKILESGKPVDTAKYFSDEEKALLRYGKEKRRAAATAFPR